MKTATTMLLACLTLAACATAQALSHDGAPRASDVCILMAQGKDASLSDPLDEGLRATLGAIETQPLAAPRYRCGDLSYQTDAHALGLTYVGVGFSADRRFASLVMQSVAGPLAGSGHRCLFENKDESWILRGCQMDWIS